MIFFRSLIYVLIQAPVTIFFCVSGLLSVFLPFSWRYHWITTWSRTMIFLLKHICKIDHEIIGLENLPKYASVVLCKHQSGWETIFLQKLLPVQTWVLKKQLLWIPFFGWGLALLQPIAINRQLKTSIKQLIEQGKAKLAKERWVIIFPEGTRIKVGETGKYARSGAELAIKANRPIVPMAHNAGLFWPKNSFLKYPGKITLVIGKAIYPSSPFYYQKDSSEITEEVKNWIENTTRELERKALSRSAQ